MITDDAVVTYLNAHFRPDAAADLLAAAQPLMAIAWAEGFERGTLSQFEESANPYRTTK